MATICPKYEGSVSTSWYPLMDVLKHISPVTVAMAPNASPQKIRPSSSARIAVMIERTFYLLGQSPANPKERSYRTRHGAASSNPPRAFARRSSDERAPPVDTEGALPSIAPGEPSRPNSRSLEDKGGRPPRPARTSNEGMSLPATAQPPGMI